LFIHRDSVVQIWKLETVIPAIVGSSGSWRNSANTNVNAWKAECLIDYCAENRAETGSIDMNRSVKLIFIAVFDVRTVMILERNIAISAMTACLSTMEKGASAEQILEFLGRNVFDA
jgi:hypothetical protein